MRRLSPIQEQVLIACSRYTAYERYSGLGAPYSWVSSMKGRRTQQTDALLARGYIHRGPDNEAMLSRRFMLTVDGLYYMERFKLR